MASMSRPARRSLGGAGGQACRRLRRRDLRPRRPRAGDSFASRAGRTPSPSTAIRMPRPPPRAQRRSPIRFRRAWFRNCPTSLRTCACAGRWRAARSRNLLAADRRREARPFFSPRRSPRHADGPSEANPLPNSLPAPRCAKRRYCATMVRNGLLNRLQEQLRRLARRADRGHGNWRHSWRKPSARAVASGSDHADVPGPADFVNRELSELTQALPAVVAALRQGAHGRHQLPFLEDRIVKRFLARASQLRGSPRLHGWRSRGRAARRAARARQAR